MEVVSDLIKKNRSAYKSRQFYKYIEYIRFPLFKNLEEDTRIDFNFPLTAFVGPNGSGKSSTLHGLYGAPQGRSPGDYWFETDIDPITPQKRDDNKRPSLVYGYFKNQGNLLEALKVRIYTKVKE